VIGAPLLVLGLLLALTAVLGGGLTGRGRGAVASFLLSPLHPATWAATAAIVAGFFVGVVAFSIVVGLLAGGASILVVGIGFVVVALGIEAARLTARWERHRAGWADDRPLIAHPYRPYGSTPRDLVLALFFDMARWRDVVYALIAFPLIVLEFVAVAVLWSIVLTALSMPLWWLAGGLPFDRTGVPLSDGGVAVIAFAVGVVLLPVAATVAQGLMRLHRAVVGGLLCESERRALERRVERLESSRRAVLDVEAGELRRIERDLHDGAQQRLVMLSINLGLAAERLDDDPAAAKALVVDARDQARLALQEIRDLVRGIAPSILMDRGLVPALSALAGRNPVPTSVSSGLAEGARFPDSVERTAYFVVAEALANVAKHAGATRCAVRVTHEDGRLIVEIEDDGRGGATLVPGGGLAGLGDRLAALDGWIETTSPVGGPTTVRATIPASPSAATAWRVPGEGAVPGWPAPYEPR
jgi:signal transduction histidine kinase